MYDKNKFTTHVVKTLDGSGQVISYQGFIDPEHVGALSWQTPVFADMESLDGWLADLQIRLKDARCLWCGELADYVTEIDDLEVFAFDTTACHYEAMREVDAMR